MKREQRLRSNADFQKVRARAGRGWSNSLLTLYASPNDLDHSRFGITISKRVAKSAVVRNRVRRRIREAIGLSTVAIRPGFDVVLIARSPAVQATWSEVRDAVHVVLGRGRLYASASGAHG